MTSITTISYLSIDGKIFENKEDCIEHENNITKNNIILLDYNRKRISFSDFDLACTIRIKNETGLKTIQKLDGGKQFSKIGTYIWEEQTDKFFYIDDILLVLKEFE